MLRFKKEHSGIRTLCGMIMTQLHKPNIIVIRQDIAIWTTCSSCVILVTIPRGGFRSRLTAIRIASSRHVQIRRRTQLSSAQLCRPAWYTNQITASVSPLGRCTGVITNGPKVRSGTRLDTYGGMQISHGREWLQYYIPAILT